MVTRKTITRRHQINFGQAVAISGDWVAVSAPNYYNSNSTYGRVRLYKRSDTTWALQQTLTPPNAAGAEGAPR